VLLLLWLASAQSAWALDAAKPKPLASSLTGSAKADYEAAKNLYGVGDFKAAALKFRSAYDSSKDPRLLWNVATCEKSLRHYARVLEAVRQYVAEGDDFITAQERSDADDVIKTVEPVVSKVQLAIREPEATVSIDGEEIGKSPLGRAILVDVGAHAFKITKPGFRPYEKQITLTLAAVTLDIALVPDVHIGRLEIVTNPGASVFVDGKVLGTSRAPIALSSGIHALRITAKGMRTHQADIAIEDDRLRTVHVTLEKEPSSGGPSAWLFVAGGALLASGLAVGGYFLLRAPDEKPLPAPGTLEPGYVFTHF
jgi:PEGA domain